MKKTLYFIFYFTMLVMTSFCRERDKNSETKIIGGQKSSLKEFPSTIFLKTGCTGVKIAGDKILTAAHCVISKEAKQIKPQFLPEEKTPLAITYHDEVTSTDASRDIFLDILDVSINKAYLKSCEKNCDKDHSLASISPNPKDLAVITIHSDQNMFQSIPSSELNLNFNEKDYEAKIVGFGCEIDAELIAQEPFRLKSAEASMLPFSDLLKESLIEPSTLSTLYQNYFITKGNSYTANGASLCPGDSGGPFYVRKKNSRDPWQVGGVHSFAMPSKKNQNGISEFNAHSKIDLSDFLSSKSQALNVFDQVFLKEDCSDCRLIFKLGNTFKNKSGKIYSELTISRSIQKLLKDNSINVWINATSVEISKKQNVVILNLKAGLKNPKTQSFDLLTKVFEKDGIELLSSRKL